MITAEEFWALPVSEQRVMVAKDVIAQIDNGSYTPSKGKYLKFFYSDTCDDIRVSFRENQEFIKDCEVCGVGGCLLSIIRFVNELTIQELADETATMGKSRAKLTNVFGDEMLGKIELLFEDFFPQRGNFSGPWWEESSYFKEHVNRGDITIQSESDEIDNVYFSSELHKIVSNFSNKYSKPSVRLTAIMNHIIENKGEITLI